MLFSLPQPLDGVETLRKLPLRFNGWHRAERQHVGGYMARLAEDPHGFRAGKSGKLGGLEIGGDAIGFLDQAFRLAVGCEGNPNRRWMAASSRFSTSL